MGLQKRQSRVRNKFARDTIQETTYYQKSYKNTFNNQTQMENKGSSRLDRLKSLPKPRMPGEPSSASSSEEEHKKKQPGPPVTFMDEMTTGKRSLECPLLVMADSYKAAHFKMYPKAQVMVAYGEFRKAMDGMDDDRIVVYGIRHYIEQLINRLIDGTDIDAAIAFYKTHNGPSNTEYPYPDEIFKYIRTNKHFPVTIEALPEGSVVYPHTPVYIITAEAPNAHFCTFLETILTMIWYPCSVATLSRHTRQLIEDAFEKSVDESGMKLLPSRLHDFGFRGCTCIEQSVIGGTAHLLSFTGSDTMSACYHAQYHLNGGTAVGSSIPATEHSVMTSWKTELEAINQLIDAFPGTAENYSLIACVMDSYDYDNALNNLLPSVIKKVIDNHCILILRPDSGDPVKQVIKALKAAERALLTMPDNHKYITTNTKKFKVLSNVGVIQGDGINYDVIKQILEATLEAGYSAQNVAFGMGGGLLQKVNRDTMSFATKLSYIRYENGEEKDVMKRPATDREKWSIPGKVKVLRQIIETSDVDISESPTPHPATESKPIEEGPTEKESDGSDMLGPHMVYTEKAGIRLINAGTHTDSMQLIYKNGPVVGHTFESFQKVRDRLDQQWKNSRPHMSALDATIIFKQDTVAKRIKADNGKPQLASQFTNAKVLSISTIEPYNHYNSRPETNSQSSSSETHSQQTSVLRRLDSLISRIA
jgi:nicotinic acid phosphoribosyltransferase